MNQLADSEGRTVVRIEVDSDKLYIDAVCINCNKRFTSIRAISMHLRMTAARPRKLQQENRTYGN